MNAVEKQYFQELTKIRSIGADVLSQSYLSGIWEGIIEKYSDQAHFIYELLQNADDVGATYANFELHPDKLVFKHNGTRHFHISNPDTEETDKTEGRLGDLNSISSAAQSSKKGKDSIGKFGVGFKAVFQYTTTPYIYDPNMAFKIERYIVPKLLDGDYPGRKENETVFVFPFDHNDRSASDAFDDIFDKLRKLQFPVLFLQHLKDVSFNTIGSNVNGTYNKICVKEEQFGNIRASKLILQYKECNRITTDRLWLFSRKDDNNLDYCVGFFQDYDGKLKPANLPAFCYFPTKEVTKLNFIIHAPFLLTDSREGIKAGEQYNKDLISLLAKLSADALSCLRVIGKEEGVRLIDDKILNIIPFNENEFTLLNDKSKISFLPFYYEIKDAVKNGLIPGRNEYYYTDISYWADTVEICNLFSDDQLAQLLGKEAHWVFCSYGRNSAGHNASEGLADYIDDITIGYIRENEIFSRIDYEFITRQSIEWLHKFYEWIADVPRRFNSLKSKPIFLDTEGNPVASYDEDYEKTLFLPSSSVKDCPTIHPDLLLNEKTKSFLLDVVKLEEPSLQDYIYNSVIPNFIENEEIDSFEYFKLFYNYYKECRATEIDDYIDKIKHLRFLDSINENGDCWRTSAEKIYYPDEKLVEYFSTKPDTYFLNLKKYTDAFPNDDNLLTFFNNLGIIHVPVVTEYELNYIELKEYNDLPRKTSTKGHKYVESRVDGCFEFVDYIADNKIADKSYLLWDILVGLFENGCNLSSDGRCYYYYYSSRVDLYKSIMVRKMRETKWLVDMEGEFVSADEINIGKLSSNYNTESESARKLIEYLGISLNEFDDLSEEQIFTNMCKKYGIESEDDMREFFDWKQQKNQHDGHRIKEPGENPIEEPQSVVDSIAKDISRKAKIQRPENERINQEQPISNDTDRDEFTPGAIDYSSKIEKEKEKQAEQLKELAQMQELQELAVSSERYSYLWFKTLLDMEILNSDIDSLDSREINISFSKIEKDASTKKTFILKYPSKNIPQYMEELADIPLVIHMKDGTSKSIAIEVSSVQSYTLKVILKDQNGLADINLSDVLEISIKASKPVFLLQSLKEKMLALEDKNGNNLEDNYNLKENLPNNLEFVFGPPGTGKTTYLANNVLIPLMKQDNDVKVLVLTPTNKAADVITARIMDNMGEDTSYNNWLIRFGITGDERIESSDVFREKTFDLRSFCRSVTVTTIARFAYDFFMPKDERLYLDSLNWDYIVIDEASMIPIFQIIYPLYKKTPKKFIIAGDPFQIEPITTVDLWADENIYKFVELNSFTNPMTKPYDYDVVKLTTQYRSTPEIGKVFSEFTYGGILKHKRESTSRRDLHFDGIVELNSLNVIKFPVSKYESIYRPKRLNSTTPYQIYSAIFTMEFTNFLSDAISKRNPGEKFNIGIVAPYKAQASLIDRLISSVVLPKEINVQVGTIHGFQGDECDIVLAVFNVPPSISSNPKLFINKQNVLNVAISRAKDYLFVIMPDDQTDNIWKLQKIKNIEELMRDSRYFTEYTTSEIEKIIFNDERYIEENSFATSHQTVNVYGQPEKKYEIRSEDNAVDVQVHRTEKIVQDIHVQDPSKMKHTSVTSKPVSNVTSKSISHEKKEKINVGDKVTHEYFGEGIVSLIDSSSQQTNIVIHFSDGYKSFLYPDAFVNGFLKKV